MSAKLISSWTCQSSVTRYPEINSKFARFAPENRPKLPQKEAGSSSKLIFRGKLAGFVSGSVPIQNGLSFQWCQWCHKFPTNSGPSISPHSTSPHPNRLNRPGAERDGPGVLLSK